jgi:hypothetical protein
MEHARATWTDERLDDLARRVDGGFSRLDEDLRSQRAELGGRIDALGTRIDALQRSMLQIGGGMIATLVVGFVGLIATRF